MPGTFFGLQIGASGLAAAQLGQEVVGNNISNASTPGYSVESADFQAADPYTLPSQFSGAQKGMLGTGVVVGSITRARDQFLDAQVRSGTSQQADQSAQSGALNQIQDAFGEPSKDGINTALGTLFQNFNNLVNNPEDIGVRTTVVQSADALSRVFQSVQGSLSSIGQQLTANQASDMTAINSYGQQIAGLNATIRSNSTKSQSDNTLLDQRDLLLDKLSSLANITINNNSDGTVNVSIGSSDLVQGIDATTLSLTGPGSLTARGDLSSGELGGLVKAQAELAGYQSDLNNLAGAVITSVNAQHRKGAGLDGTTGLDFFTGTDAATIAVNPTLITNPEKLAAAAEPAGGGVPAPGDAGNATLLGALETTPVAIGPAGSVTTQPLQGFYQSRISNLAGQGAAAQTALGSATANTRQLTQQRDSVTGVSTDSEMVNMMKYQQAYAASARVVQTMDGMLNTLINNLFSN